MMQPLIATAPLPVPPPTPVAPERRPDIPALTSLRFFAAAAIFVFHSAGYFGFPQCFAIVGTACQSVALGQAVSLFFVLSGFILAYNYPDLAAGGRARFLWARFARLWPAHVASLLLFLAVIRPPLDPFGLAANVAMVHAWIPVARFYFAGNPVSWSISTEFFFYLAFIPLIGGWRRAWRWRFGATLALAVGGVALAAAIRAPLNFIAPGVTGYGLVYFSPLARLFEFVAGMGAALAWERFAPRYRPVPAVGTAVETAALALVGWLLMGSRAGAGSLGAATPLGAHASAWLSSGGLMAMPFAALILVLAFQRGAVSRHLFALPLLVILGEMSYPIYLTHQIGLRHYNGNRVAFDAAAPGVVLYAVVWAVVLCVSYLVWRLVERPSRAWLLSLPLPWLRDTPPAAPPRPQARSRPLGPLAAASALAVLLPLVGYAQLNYPLPTHRAVAAGAVSQAAGASVPDARGVIFADPTAGAQIVLEAAEIERTEADVRVRLTWRAVVEHDLIYTLVARLTDDGANPVAEGDYPQHSRPLRVMAGATWQEYVVIPADAAVQGRATKVGIGRYRPQPGSWLVADRGPRYANGILLLIPLVGGPPSA